MSGRRSKLVRRLVHHWEYGGYVPAQQDSKRRLDAMGLAGRQLRRASAMAERKARKENERVVAQYEREGIWP